jgi:hypothetical protein
LDEIIAFSGIEHHIDTPIKRYSSGMKVRLGFAVAAHLEPDILDGGRGAGRWGRRIPEDAAWAR